MTQFAAGDEETGYTPSITKPDVKPPIVEVSEPCELCGEVLTGKSRGSGSIAWHKAVHRANKHGIKGERTRRKKAPSAEDYERHPIASVATDMAAEVTGSRGVPKADELANAFARGITIGMYGAASLAVETDKYLDPRYRESLIQELTVDERDVRAIMQPVGKIAAGSSFNAKHGRTIVDNVDVLGALAGFTQVGVRWATYLRERRIAARELGPAPQAQPVDTPPPFQPGQAQQPPVLAPVPTPQPGEVFVSSLADQPIRPDLASANGYSGAPDFTDSRAGQVLTAADVIAMQQRGA